jgi:hypothetical protein
MKIDKITPQIAALYLGQKCELRSYPASWDFEEIKWDGFHHVSYKGCISPETLRYLTFYSEFEVTPHLRRLESLTEEEAGEIHVIGFGRPYAGIIPCKEWIHVDWSGQSCFLQDAIGTPAALLYLLSKGFDLFGLIDSGLAKEMSR